MYMKLPFFISHNHYPHPQQRFSPTPSFRSSQTGKKKLAYAYRYIIISLVLALHRYLSGGYILVTASYTPAYKINLI